MRRSPALDASRPSPQFDEYDFRRSMNDIGRAYRNQAIELIAICRLFAQATDQGFTQDAELTRVLQACDLALERAAEARKGLSPASTESIESAVRELREYESTYHRIIADSTTNSVRERMNKAKQKDERQSKKAFLDRMLGKGTSTNSAFLTVVEFHLMESLTDDQPTIVRQELTNYSKPQEVLWNFSRCRRNRLTLAKNPHFYHRLPPTSPNANWNEPTPPIEHNWHTHPIYVLTNIPGRVFLECGPNRRAFDNVWSINGTLVFKGVSGRLWSESMVGAPIQDRPCFWCLIEPPPPPPAVVPPIHAWMPIPDWKDAIAQLLLSPDIKIRITENT